MEGLIVHVLGWRLALVSSYFFDISIYPLNIRVGQQH
jgi:hypothetical protein